MSEQNEKLRHLIQVLNTGEEFYHEAKDRITDEDLQHFFDAAIIDKKRVLDELQPALAKLTGSVEEGSDLEARLEEYRAQLLSVVQSNDAYVYMDHLEDLEEKTQEAYTEALNAAESSELRQKLESLRDDFQYMHARMQAAENAAGNREAPKTMPTRMMRH